MFRRLSLLLAFLVVALTSAVKYRATWESIDSRPLPKWYDEAKFGIFIHWGVYSVPSFGTEWFWSNLNSGASQYVQFMKNNYPPGHTYQEFAHDFKTEFFQPKEWAKLFQKSGARYVVLTSKHHEGYTMWPSTYSFSWNSKDVGPHRDLVGELANAIRNTTDLRFGLYHSLYEWFNPMFLSDKASNFESDEFVQKKVLPELHEIVNKYRPEIVWSDGEWEANDTYWKSKEFLAWLYNESPVKDTVVTNDRWGSGPVICQHGGFYTCADRYNPGVLQAHKWENAMTIDAHSWGYRRNANIGDYLTTHQLIATLTKTVSCGGNLLMNVGPTSEGTISPIFQERLLDMGKWLNINGEAIYNTQPWIHQNETLTNVWYTSNTNSVYAIVLNWPKDNLLRLEKITKLFENEHVSAYILGQNENVEMNLLNNALQVTFPDKSTVQSEWAWVIKFKTSSSANNLL
ncbi:hypothetical protein PPYR_09902 [Photinus pyralis]|uniref:Putative alpha-L-fucosidase n=1 Tax=Photinus pyralis TaxID=7054 RepID=A0A5N4AEW1_PHOPY|nr:alpha-L-fucosidase-like [Photinus pyralis]KAB0795841.1 hypothetical protein PPYR_09902 [Photinus pyralis]